MLACTPRRAPDPRRLEVVVAQEAETIDPRFVVDAVGMRVSRLVHAGLFRLDPDTLEPVPYLAASFRWEDPRTLDVTLREDVRFHSGAPLRAADVVATLDALRDPALHARAAHVVSAIDRVEARGDREVRIHMSRAHATLLTDLEVPILRADQARDASIDGAALDGLGPYRVSVMRAGLVDLEPAENGAVPAHRPLRILTVHDENARALRLIGGQTDVAPSGVSPSLLPTLEHRGLRVASRPGANLVYVLFRTDRGPFADRDARRAFGLAIDRDAIVTDMLGGRAHVANGIFPPMHWVEARGAERSAPSFSGGFGGGAPDREWPRAPEPHDVAKARDLLHQKHVSCTLLGSTDRLRVAIARVMAQDLAEAGIDCELVPLELGTLLARLGAGDFDAAVLEIPELAEPNTLRVFLHSASIPPNGANRGRVRDDVVDAALDEGDATLDLVARRAAYARLEQRVLDQAYLIPLWHEDEVVVTSARAASFLPSSEGRWLGLAAVP